MEVTPGWATNKYNMSNEKEQKEKKTSKCDHVKCWGRERAYKIAIVDGKIGYKGTQF